METGAQDVVVADGRTVVASPVDVPEAARAEADTSASDGQASSHAILARTLDPLEPDLFATRSVRTEARTTRATASTYAPRSSRGPPSA